MFQPLHPWSLTVAEAREVQIALRERLVLEPPAGFAPRIVAGADVSAERFSRRGYAGVVLIDRETMETVEEASAAVDLIFPYVPGYLSFRELPALAAAWEKVGRRPDVVVWDAHGYAHPRRFGVACHGGVLLDIPSIGCAKTMFVGEHGPLAWERGSIAEIVDKGEVVGVALRTRDGCNPVYVSAGHRMDLGTAVALVLSLCRYRQPETTRRSHNLVNDLRRADKALSPPASDG
jgi:deoxyribonuclease V